MRARVLISAVAFLLSLSLPSEGEGHAVIKESSPQAGEILTVSPSRLIIRFNSRIVHSLSRVTLLGPDRRVVPTSTTATEAQPPAPDRLEVVLPSLSPGVYVVQWQALSVDGHITAGRFSFTIQPQGSDGIR